MMKILNLLSVRESTIYELLKQHLRPPEIVQQTGISNSTLYMVIQKLISMKFIIKEETAYVPLVLHYELKVCSKRQVSTKVYQVPYEKMRISPDVERYLLKNYSMKRTTLANRTGLPRYVINRELIRLQERMDGGSANAN